MYRVQGWWVGTALAALLLGGCGAGETSVPQQHKTRTMSVTAIDGYLQDAVVWLDVDNDGVLDDNEPTAQTGADGQATLNVTALVEAGITPSEHRLVVQAVAGVTRDRGDGTTAPVTVTRSYMMSAPAGYALVTPFTTLIDQAMQADTGLTSTEAADKVATRLGLSGKPENLLTDYMAKKNYRQQLYASNLATLLPGKFTAENRDGLLQQSDKVGKLLGDYLTADPAAVSSSAPAVSVVLGDNGSVTITESRQQLLTHLDEDSHAALVLQRQFERKVTRNSDGSRSLTESGSDYYYDRETGEVELLNKQPLRYQDYTLTESHQVDGSFVRQMSWQKDLDKDGKQGFVGQAVAKGQDTADGESYWLFVDQNSVQKELGVAAPQREQIYASVFDGKDLLSAIEAKDFSMVDQVSRVSVQYQSGSTVTSTTTTYAPLGARQAVTDPLPADWLSMDGETVLPKASYGQTLTLSGQESGTMTADLQVDWNHDGSVNGHYLLERKANGTLTLSSETPVYACPQDGQFEEYADYNWQQPSVKTSYWYEKSSSSSLVDGHLVTRRSGHRYLLDMDKAQKRVTEAAPQGIEFSKYSSVTTNVSDSEQRLYATWVNYHLADEEATADKTEPGQQYVVTLKGDNDLWVGHRFAEWGTRAVEDLADKVEVLRTQGIALDKIDASLLPGLSDYNGLLLNNTFRYDANHQPRTWYWVTNRDLKSANYPQIAWKKVKIKLVNEGYKQWLINDADGALIFTIPNTDEPFNWYTFYDTVAIAATGISTRSGHIATWAGHFFLDESEADDFLTQKQAD